MPPIAAIPRSQFVKGLYGLLVFTVVTAVAGAQGPVSGRQPVVDKSVFHLFNPTPPNAMREMDTDGPGATESPYTVDAGHFQVETALVSYTTDRASSGSLPHRVEAWAIAPMILKIGLLNRLDAQLLLEPYNRVYERAGAN